MTAFKQDYKNKVHKQHKIESNFNVKFTSCMFSVQNCKKTFFLLFTRHALFVCATTAALCGAEKNTTEWSG